MQGPFLRKYGVETTIDFALYDTDGLDLKTDAVHASGDTKIMQDEAAEANTSNGFVDEGQGYSITISATEMQAARIVIYVVDQGTKAWMDDFFIIETYGHASAMHEFDLDLAAGDNVIESNDSITAQQALSIILAAVVGDNAVTATTVRDPSGTNTRIQLTISSNKRSSITLTPSS